MDWGGIELVEGWAWSGIGRARGQAFGADPSETGNVGLTDIY